MITVKTKDRIVQSNSFSIHKEELKLVFKFADFTMITGYYPTEAETKIAFQELGTQFAGTGNAFIAVDGE